MRESEPKYAPWSRTEREDNEIQKPLQDATPSQFSAMVKDLVEIAEKRSAPKTDEHS